MSEKKSEFIAIDTVPDDYSFNVFGNSVDRKISKTNLFSQIKDESFSPFIYPTIELLEGADLEADEDNPTYVRCEETEYRLYKITNLAAGVDDITLDNGNTATYQVEYRDIGFVIGPGSSTTGSIAIFSDTSGAQLDDLLVPTNAGKAFMQATDSATVTYARKNADNTVTMRTASQHFDDIKQSAGTGYSGAIETATATTAKAGVATDEAITPALFKDAVVFETVSDLALVSKAVGTRSTTKGADAAGDGGHGIFITEAASGTPDPYWRVLLPNGNHDVLQPVNGSYNALQFGDVFNDSAQVLVAFGMGNIVFPAGEHDLGGNAITITNSVNATFCQGCKFTNGRLIFSVSDTDKKVVFNGTLKIEQGSVRIVGSPDLAHTDEFSPDQNALTVICDDINVTDMYTTGGNTTSVYITNIKNSKIGNITVTGTCGAVANAQAILIQDVYDSEISGCVVNGDWPMGVHFDSSSTRAAYALCRSSVGYVNVFKSSADQSGDHGFYWHASYASKVGAVYGSGWGGTISSCADYKFRDNWLCETGVVSVGNFRITADNNYSFFTQYNQDNSFQNVYCQKFSGVSTSPGYSLRNVFDIFWCEDIALDSNQSTKGGYIFSGETRIRVATSGADVNMTGVEFRGANVTLVNAPDFTGLYFTTSNTTITGNLNFLPTGTSVSQMDHTTVVGTFTHDGASTTHDFNWRHVYISGAISIANSGVSRVTTANWHHVGSGAVEGGLAFDVKKYRYVSFDDATYDLV